MNLPLKYEFCMYWPESCIPKLDEVLHAFVRKRMNVCSKESDSNRSQGRIVAYKLTKHSYLYLLSTLLGSTPHDGPRLHE